MTQKKQKKRLSKKLQPMSRAVREIIKGFNEYAAFRRGEENGTIVYTFPKPPEVNVQAIRKKLDMTQEEFTSFGFSLSAIRHWEAKRRTPEGPARLLLKIIERHPKLVLDTLHC